MHIIELLKKQAKMYADRLDEMLGKAKTKADVYVAHSTVLKEFYNHAFKPTIDKNGMREFDASKTDDLMQSLYSDIGVAYDELEYVSSRLQEAYNTNQDYKTSVKNRVLYLTSIISDLNTMSGQSNEMFMMFEDSLTNYDFVDKEFSVGEPANISTSEGIAHLSVTNDIIMTDNIEDIKVTGNGIAGNYYVVKKVNIETINPEYNIYAKYQSDDDAHDSITEITDSEVHTWYEYEKVGFSNTNKLGRYDIEWATAEQIHDELTLKISIKLKGLAIINWLDIIPYMPEQARSTIDVYSIKVSDDGSNFTSIYKDKDIIDSEIHIVPQRFLNNPLFSDDNIAKFASQGVFSFPTVSARYIEIVLKQTKPYDEYIGCTYYKEVNISNTGEVFERLIPTQSVPSYIVNGPIGKYQLETNKLIVKGIDIIDGWRYCIGVRGVDVYNKKFEKQSEIVTRKLETTMPIRKVVLYANEIIPDEYLAYGLEKRNDWLKYYISINDTDWYPIAPMHHNQVGDLKIPPKVYEINSLAPVEERITSLNKGYITSPIDVTSIRLKVVFSRPDELSGTTPILEEYGLKCIFGGTV